jgi:imidazolonepropionase-like amidohydrolase
MDTERTLTGQTVLVSGGRISAVGPAGDIEVPDGFVTVDGEGRWLVPGIGEMHAHVPPGPAAEEVLFLYLSQGITTARGMLGQPEHLALRERLASGEVLGPRLYTTGPSINGTSVPSPDSAVRAVRHQKEMGYDLLKIHPGLTRESYDAMAETAREVGITWAGHVPADVGLARALEAGQASVDHLDQYMEAVVAPGTDVSQSLFFGLNLAGFADDARIEEVARATAEAGVWNVPTQSLIENMASPTDPADMATWPSMRYMAPEQVAAWVTAKSNFMNGPAYSETAMALAIDVRRRIIKALSDAGAGILLGSDAPQVFQVPGFSIQHEIEILVASGLTPFQALRAGTYNVAVYLDALDEFGTVEEGKAADLILLEGDPLADIQNLARRAGVMARGRWLPASEIRGRLDEIAAAHEAER